MPEREYCHWCGHELEAETLLWLPWGIATDPVTRRPVVLTACSEEHLRELQAEYRAESRRWVR